MYTAYIMVAGCYQLTTYYVYALVVKGLIVLMTLPPIMKSLTPFKAFLANHSPYRDSTYWWYGASFLYASSYLHSVCFFVIQAHLHFLSQKDLTFCPCNHHWFSTVHCNWNSYSYSIFGATDYLFWTAYLF